MTFDTILRRGVQQLITTFTDSSPGQEDSGMDHFYTNSRGDISSIQVMTEGHADHEIFDQKICEEPKLQRI